MRWREELTVSVVCGRLDTINGKISELDTNCQDSVHTTEWPHRYVHLERGSFVQRGGYGVPPELLIVRDPMLRIRDDGRLVGDCGRADAHAAVQRIQKA